MEKNNGLFNHTNYFDKDKPKPLYIFTDCSYLIVVYTKQNLTMNILYFLNFGTNFLMSLINKNN